MRWLTLWVLVLLVLVMLVMAVPAIADNWAPDEIGTALIIGDNPGSVPAVSASSWELYEARGIRLFGTLLALERGDVGIGIDAGQSDKPLRGGIGYVTRDLWGVYMRYRF